MGPKNGPYIFLFSIWVWVMSASPRPRAARALWLALLAWHAARGARATSLTSALTSSYGPSGSSNQCGYGSASCTCSSMFLMSGGYTGTIPSDLGNCTSMLFLCARGAPPRPRAERARARFARPARATRRAPRDRCLTRRARRAAT